MALSVVFGLAVLSAAANYGAAFEFSGLDPSFHSKTQFKPFDKPFSSLTFQPRTGESVKPFGFKSAAAKPFGGAPFDSFRPSYYQPGPFRTNYQPFGPYPGYPGPVVYPGHGAGYSAPSAYPSQPTYRFDGADQKPDFGYQPFPQQPTFNKPDSSAPQQPAFKSGAPAKKYTKPVPDFSDLQAGKYFYEHQFGMNHGPEFSSAIVPAEHHIKQSRPKDAWLLGKPAVPSLNEFGLPKPSAFGFAPPSSFKYPVPQFSAPIQSFVNTLPSDKSASSTIAPEDKTSLKLGGTAASVAVSTESSSQDESATARSSDAPSAEEVTPSAAADPQPTNPSSEEGATANAEVGVTNNQVSATDDSATKELSGQSGPAETGENVAANPAPSFGSQETESQTPVAASDPVVVEPVQENAVNAVDAADKPAAAAQENDAQVPSTESAAVESGTAAPANDPTESSAAVSSPAESTAPKSEEVKENETANKPTESEAVSSSPGLPNEPFGAPLPLSNPSTTGLFASSEFPPYFGKPSIDFQQPSYIPYYDAPKFTDEQLKSFIADFGTGLPAADFGTGLPAADFGTGLPADFGTGFPVQPAVVPGSADAAAVTPTESSLPVSSSAPSVLSGENAEISGQKAEISGEKAEISGEKAQESDEKKEPTPTSDSESRNIPEAPKKSNTVQILPEDPFNGQLPLLYDPSNAASPLDAYRFYNHPAVSALSSQASLAAYSPEDAFTNFGTQFRQGYLVEGSPSLTPVTKTIVQTGLTPLSISSAEHPLHSQVFKYSQSFVPYPGLVVDNAPAFRSLEAPSSTVAAADAAAATTPAADTVSSTPAAAAAEAVTESDNGSATVSTAV